MEVNKKYLTYGAIALVAAVLIAIGFFSFHADRILTNNQVAFLDVGQGDATLIKMDNGALILIDCGPDSSVLRGLSRHLSMRQKTIDYLVITHGDRDHFGGCLDVLKSYVVNNIVSNGVLANDTDPMQIALVQAMHDEGADEITITRPIAWQFASSSVTFLYPDHDLAANNAIPGTTKQSTSNSQSIVARVQGTRAQIMLTGDMEASLEAYLIKRYTSSTLASTILKAGHHGSKSSSSEPFIKIVRPTTAIISAGAHNRYGHPAPIILARLKRHNVQTRRTDQEGDIVLDF